MSRDADGTAIYSVRPGSSGGEGEAFLGMSGVGVARATVPHQVLAEDNQLPTVVWTCEVGGVQEAKWPVRTRRLVHMGGIWA